MNQNTPLQTKIFKVLLPLFLLLYIYNVVKNFVITLPHCNILVAA